MLTTSGVSGSHIIPYEVDRLRKLNVPELHIRMRCAVPQTRALSPRLVCEKKVRFPGSWQASVPARVATRRARAFRSAIYNLLSIMKLRYSGSLALWSMHLLTGSSRACYIRWRAETASRTRVGLEEQAGSCRPVRTGRGNPVSAVLAVAHFRDRTCPSPEVFLWHCLRGTRCVCSSHMQGGAVPVQQQQRKRTDATRCARCSCRARRRPPYYRP